MTQGLSPALGTASGAAEEFPLSPAQLGMWYAQLLDPDVPLYEASYLEMRGRLDIELLKAASYRAAREIGSSMLRLVDNGSGPRQVIDPTIEHEIRYLDLSGSDDPNAEAMRWMRADVAAPIDLVADPLGVSVLFRVAPDRVFWYTRVHHIVLDGFASSTVMYRVAELYNAALAGVEPKASAAASLREVYEAEASYLGSTRFAADSAYWAERIDHMPRRCSLVEAAAPAHALGRQHRIMMSEAMTEQLDTAAARFGVGSPALAMAALAIYYARMTASPEVVLSLPVSGRTTAMLRRSGGMLANVVPLRLEVGERRTVAEIIDAVRIEVSGALRHQRFRYEDIRQSGSESVVPVAGRGLVGPVFNIMLFPRAVDFTGIESSPHVLTSGPIEDLFVNLYQLGAQSPIRIDFSANPDLYDEDSLTRHHRRFMRVFESLLAADSDTPVGELGCFLDDERHLLDGTHGPAAPEPRLLSEVLDSGLRAAGPDAVAVYAGSRTLAYGALDERSNLLARGLITAGAGPETSVLVALPRSVESVLAFWGVARSGAAYVPVGTGNPAERVATMATECGARLGITVSALVDSLPDSVRWILLDDPAAELVAEGAADTVAAPVLAAHPAYIVFTSGSTGVPKGVAVTHSGLSGLVAAVADSYQAGPGSRVLHCLNPSFDASLLELLAAFSVGASLVVAEGDAVVGAGLAEVIAEYGVTHLVCTAVMLSTLPEGALDGVRAVLAGAEVIPPEVVTRFGSGRRLMNSYGPCEATIAASSTEGLVENRPAGIGHPAPGVGLLVLDRRLRPVPVGALGELYITGAGLARGYVGQAGLTADRFVANPFGPPGARMYRTGDLVRWRATEGAGQGAARARVGADGTDSAVAVERSGRASVGGDGAGPGVVGDRSERAGVDGDGAGPAVVGGGSGRAGVDGGGADSAVVEEHSGRVGISGNGADPATVAERPVDVVLEYMGRTDFQVKLRGMRVEPSEVDAVLTTHPAVEIAVTVPRLAATGRTMLASYVVPVHRGESLGAAEVNVAELREFCVRRLPAHMVPGTVTVLDALPLTGNGKVDRRALPEPVIEEPVFTPAATDTERALCALFAEVLGGVRVGAQSSFFALGGDSILSIQLVSRARADGLVFSARDVFEHPTPAALATVVTAPGGRQLLREMTGGGVGFVPSTPIVAWLLEQPGWERFAQSMVLALPSGMDRDRLAQTLQAVLDRHDMLRARMVADGLEVSAPGAVDAATVLRRLSVTEIDDTATESVITAATDRLDPAAGVMVAATWLDPGAHHMGRLVLVVHHLAVDAVSWRILIADLMTAWAQVAAGTAPMLPEVSTSMRTWAHALADAARREEWTAEAAYWSQVLETPVAPLGHRALDPVVDVGRTLDRVEMRLPAELTAVLIERMPSAFRCGVEEALLTALAAALAQGRGGPELVMLERHGRDESAVPGADLSRTVGWFTDQFPLRLDIGRAADPAVALKAVKEQMRAVPHGGIGYGMLRHLNPQTAADLGAAPTPQIGFNYLGQVTAIGAIAEATGTAAETMPWLPVSLAAQLGGAGNEDLPAAALLTIDAMTVDSADGPVLHAVWRFASGAIDHDRVEELVRQWNSELTTIAQLLRDPDTGGFTPSDLPLVALTQAGIDALATRYPAIEDVWPLAPLQRGLLFHAQLDPEHADAYSVQSVFEFDGDLDTARLAAAAAELVRRHRVLRTAFVHSADSVAQVVLADVEVPWRTVTATAAECDDLAAAELDRPFDPERPPLIRFLCVRCGERDVRLVVTNHHLVLDGWSMPLLFGELLALYQTSGDSTGFAEPPSYRDYLEWLAGRDTAAAGTAWAAALDGLSAPSLVTAGREPVAGPKDPAKHILDVPLDDADSAALLRMTTEHGVTTNTLVEVAWALLLAELTGEADVVFGATVSGRPPEVAGADRMIGMMVNTIPVRITLAPAEPIAELLVRVQREQGALIDHHMLGLNEIQTAARLGPLFDTTIVFESYPVDVASLAAAVERAELRVRGFTGRDGTHYPLSIAAQARDGLLHIALTCSAEFFDAAAATGLAGRLARILTRIAEHPAGPTAAVRGMDRVDLLRSRPQPMRLLPDLLTGTGRPDRSALRYGDTELTYRELDELSNRLARVLIDAGAGPEIAVLLAVPRSSDWLVAAWAIAKSGAAFVPVDVEHPAARITAIAMACTAQLGITVADWRVRMPDTVRWQVLDESQDDMAAAAATPVSDADRLRPLRAGHPAYLIYTSGSTGTPKGVVVTHAGLSGLVAGVAAKVKARGGDRVLLCMNPNFDAAIMVWLTTYYVGATLVVAAPEVNAGPELGALIAESQVTHVFSTPAVLATLPSDALSGVRVLVTGGEACPPELTARLGSGRALLNSYGPAEATVAATFTTALIAGEEAGLGRPLPGVGLAVLDRWLRPAPMGTAGELYLMGPGLARGYTGRVGLTGERFVANPFGSPGERMYRTGDLVRRVSHTRLEYLGRNDTQVKLRGIRVEPGEVDAVLRGHPRVALAVTVPRPGLSGDRVLATYASPAAGAELTVSDLTEYLARRLPRHLVPSTVTVLEVLPLTGNGKVDLRALPEPERPVAEYVAPVGIEEPVAEAFGAVLGRSGIGAADDFFALGGDSLSATRVVARLSAELHAQVPVRLLFEASTVRGLAARLSTLTADPAAADTMGPRRGPRPDRIPLSPAQQRMWFVNQYDPGSGGYNIPIVLRVTGTFDLDAMRAALGDVLERHESLRTVYPSHDGIGYQVVVPADEVALDVDTVAVREADLAASVIDCVVTGFDVTTAIPLRLRLFRIIEHPECCVLALVVHHISADGFSMGPLARDVMTAYAARMHGNAPGWSPPAVQYADYTLWQRDRLGSAEDPASRLAQQIAYWTETLDGLPDRLDLPADRPRPIAASLRAGTVRSELDAELTTALEALARDRQSTLFMVLHSALAVLFARLSDTADVAIGTPIAGRGVAELDDVVGMFVNTVVLRTPVASAQPFTGLLDQVRRTDLDAFAHADVPFENLVDVLDPARSTARHPLIQVMLVFQNLAPVRLTLPELTVEPVDLDQQTLRFDLSVTVAEQEEGLAVRFGYATDLFDAGTIERLADRWVRILRTVAADPAIPVGDIDLLQPGELAGLVATPAPVVAEPAILPDLLAAAVAANPDGVAVVDGATALTYRDLDAHSNRLARELIRAGAGPETLVAVALRRSIDSVLAVWSVAKTGAAFVPVDPAYPAERITQILADSGARLGVTVRDVAAELPDSARGSDDSVAEGAADAVRWFVLDDPQTAHTLAATVGAPIDAAERTITPRPDNPAYVIFTSGSTGRPKGVVVTHSGLANMVAALRDRLSLTDESRVLHVASPSFDAAVLELLLAVGAAGTLVVAGRTAFGGVELGELLARERVSHIALTPSALASVDPAVLVSEDDDVPGRGALRAIITGGEPCPPELVERWAAPGRVHFNDYGPTEATIWATGSDALYPGDAITIGGPVAGMTAVVLDERLRPVPDGVAGELYLAGPALARGYHGRTGQTSTRFVADPYGRPGERMYRTGDLVRRRGGNLDYLGRSDLQVKLRGLRIELGEIESALLVDPSVHQAAVTVYTDPAVGELLVAYVVPAPDAQVSADELKTLVAQQLPSYMVPAAIMTIDALPRTGNGKLDRRALPAPDIRAGRYRPPNTPTERAIADTFGELLGVARVGLDDNFFALGGNSLIATRIVSRLGVVLNTRIPVRMVFDAPTVAEFAHAVRTAAAPPGPRPGPRRRPEHTPLSAAQRRMWFLNRYDPASPAHNVPIAVEIDGELDPVVLQSALMDVLARHESLRTVYPVDAEGEPFQDIRSVADAYVPVRVSELDAEDSMPAAVVRACAHGFDLTTELPLRVTLLRLAERRWVLVVVLHHIASDGWSMAPLTRDVMVAFGARRSGAVPQWAPLPLQYADYALWQRELLGAADDPGSVAYQQLEHWRAALDGLPDVLSLPSDHPRPAVLTHRADLVEFTVDATVQQQVRHVARWYGVSTFMVAHAALATLLSRLSDQRDVAIGSVIAGRGDGELDDLVGMFVNTLVLRSRVEPDATFETLLAATKNGDLDAFSNADVPFEQLVEVLAPARSTAHHPLFQVLLVFQNFEREPVGMPGLEVKPVEMPSVGAKFDLEWMLAEEFDADGAPAGMSGTLTFALDLFEPATADNLAQRFVELLGALTANPELVLGDLDMTAPPGTTVYPPPISLHRKDMPYRPPVTPTEHAMVAAFETVLGAERVGLDDNFFELGGTSMVATRLVAEIRDRIGFPMPVQWMFGDPSPGALAQRIIEGADPTAVDPALRTLLPMRPTGAGPSLFCIHPAIGLAWCYAGLVQHLDGDYPVYGLQSPGVTGSDEPGRPLTARAAHYADEIQRTQPSGPYRLLGYSAGGPIAHAVAVELQRRGGEVSSLIIMDGRADPEPMSAEEMPPPEALLAEFGGIDPALLPDLPGSAEIEQGDHAALADRAAELLRAAGGTFAALTATDLERLYTDYLNLVREAAAYRPEPFDGDMLFFSSVNGRPGIAPNVDTWRPYITGAITDHPVDYEHNKLTGPDALAVIGPIVAEHLR
ncbi:amino acid adenylation domain-containing protein [Nocardia sp. NPDC050710]|uniref:amino acid adenylation domain-containing protein n=1 Tax=Nocardia sp. NPDC050710 TaxID=3157220 RepID=UPI00340CACC1